MLGRYPGLCVRSWWLWHKPVRVRVCVWELRVLENWPNICEDMRPLFIAWKGSQRLRWSPDLLLARPTKKREKDQRNGEFFQWGLLCAVSDQWAWWSTGKPRMQTSYSDLPWLVPSRIAGEKSMRACVCVLGCALFANMVQPNRWQITFCGGFYPLSMAECVRFVPLDNKSCHNWQLKQALHSLWFIPPAWRGRRGGANGVPGNVPKKVLACKNVCAPLNVIVCASLNCSWERRGKDRKRPNGQLCKSKSRPPPFLVLQPKYEVPAAYSWFTSPSRV